MKKKLGLILFVLAIFGINLANRYAMYGSGKTAGKPVPVKHANGETPTI